MVYGEINLMSKKSYKDWTHIDLIALLNLYDISYSTSGKNIGSGYFGIETCPFCEAPGNHFGVRYDSNVGTCFVCGETASAPRIVKEITNEPWNKVYELLNEFSDGDRYVPTPPSPGDEVLLPDGVDNNLLSNKSSEYLLDRKFSPEEIQKKYKIQSTGANCYLEMGDNKWDFSYRIITPIIMERRLVAYSGRTFIDHDIKYMNSPTEACIIPPASCLYNIDTVKDKAIFVEGVTDVWRMGRESVGMMGIKFTSQQIAYIGSKNLKEAYIMFDKGAEDQARKLAVALSSVVNKVNVIFLEGKGDPGDLRDENALRIKYDLLGRI